jgi:hypothetical protein
VCRNTGAQRLARTGARDPRSAGALTASFLIGNQPFDCAAGRQSASKATLFSGGDFAEFVAALPAQTLGMD